jgi:hypothetical protein
MPDTGQGGLRLQDLIPPGAFVGTSLVLRRDDRFLFGMRPLKKTTGRPVIELTGIGGAIEVEDVTFAAGALREALGSPKPTMELPWLLWLCPEQILATAREDILLADLLRAGADLVTGSEEPPPAETWTRLTDSQEGLGLALGDDLPVFYRSLGVGT